MWTWIKRLWWIGVLVGAFIFWYQGWWYTLENRYRMQTGDMRVYGIYDVKVWTFHETSDGTVVGTFEARHFEYKAIPVTIDVYWEYPEDFEEFQRLYVKYNSARVEVLPLYHQPLTLSVPFPYTRGTRIYEVDDVNGKKIRIRGIHLTINDTEYFRALHIDPYKVPKNFKPKPKVVFGREEEQEEDKET
jgi:hypothetical protein